MLRKDPSSLRASFSHALLLALSFVAPVVAPATVFFTEPTAVARTETRIDFSNTAPLSRREVDCFVYTVSPGDAGQASLRDVAFRSIATGEERSAATFPEAENRAIESFLTARVSVEYLGLLGNLPLATAKVDRRRTLNAAGEVWELAAYRLEVERGAAPVTPGRALRDPLRELATTLLTTPEDVDRWTVEEIAETFPGPTEWQPKSTWLPIAVPSEGLFAIDAEWLAAAGWDEARFKPGDLTLFDEGVAIPVHPDGPEGASFSGGGRLLFYARPTTSSESAERVLWLAPSAETTTPSPSFGQIEAKPGPGVIQSPVTMLHHAEVDSELETRMGAFLSIRRMGWIWETVAEDRATTVTFDFPAWVAAEDGSSTLTLHVLAARSPIPPGLSVEASINGEPIPPMPLVDVDAPLVGTVPTKAIRGDGNQLALRLVGGREKTPYPLYLDSIDVIGPGTPRPDSGAPVRLLPRPGNPITGVHVANVRQQDLVAFDVTDPLRPLVLSGERAAGIPSVYFPTAPEAKLLLENRRHVPSPPAPRKNAWVANTTAAMDADVLVVTHPDFLEAANLLATDMKERGQVARVITTAQIYASFSHGNVSSDAIRNFAAYAVRTAPTRSPHSLILIGDANADGRNLSRQDIPNYLPMRQLPSINHTREDFISTDCFYSWLTPGDEMADMMVGRLSVATPEEAMAVVRKIQMYRKIDSYTDRQATSILAVADTGEFGDGLRDVLRHHSVEASLLHADTFPWEDNYYLPAHLLERMQDAKVSPLFTAAIEDGFNRGATVTMFFGHGAPNLWGNQRFWFGGGTPNSDILRLRNGDVLSFVTSFTCNNAVIDYPLRPWNMCIAEDFLRHEDKGAIATLMPSGPSYLNSHKILSDAFLHGWNESGIRSIGVLSELVRMGHRIPRGIDDHARMFVLLGDPTLTIGAARQATPEPGSPLSDVQLISAKPISPGDPVGWGWRLEIENSGIQECRGELIARLLDGENNELASQRLPFSVQSTADSIVPVVFDRPSSPGVYTLSIRIDGAPMARMRDAFPSASGSARNVITDDAANLWMPTDLRWGTAGYRDGTLPLSVSLVNPGKDEAVTMRLESDLLEEPITRASEYMATGRQSEIVFQLPGRALIDSPVHLRVTAEGNATSRTLTREVVISPALLPDLRIVPEYVKVTPEVLSDGVTIFVALDIENVGGSLSDPVSINIYNADDSSFESPLRDMTRRGPQMLPALEPGGRLSIRLRHDPWRNAGDQLIAAVIDADGLQPESNRENNRVTIPLHVLRKWKLVPGALTLGPGPQPGILRLLAEVGNSGEVDARGVTVTFYKSRTQTEDQRLSEIDLDHVEAQTTRTLTFDWSPTREDLLNGLPEPSFSVSLKGSQQRVSSVTGQ
ncbi:hypothetical protein GC173_14155 [bacterium]|nr:hypothetical protein [bacterium]